MNNNKLLRQELGRALEKLKKRGGVRKVLLTIPRPEGTSPYISLFKRYEIHADFIPFLQTRPITYDEFKARKIRILDHTAIVFLTRTVVDFFFETIRDFRIPIKEEWKYFCLTAQVAGYLNKYIPTLKKRNVAVGGKTLEHLVEVMANFPEHYFLIPNPPEYNKEFIRMVQEKGLRFSVAPLFTMEEVNVASINFPEYDIAVIYTGETANILGRQIPSFSRKYSDLVIACLGVETRNALEKYSIYPDIVAPSSLFPSIIDALSILLKLYHSQIF